MAGLNTRIIMCIVAVNVCLSVIGTLLNAKKEQQRRSFQLEQTMVKEVPDSTEYPNEPYIVPKLLPAQAVIEQAQQNLTAFERSSWGDSFLPNRGAIFPEWRSVIPAEHKTKPDFVFGIPTIQRQGVDYLYNTLTSLIENLGEKRNAVILVYVGTEDEKSVQQISDSIQERHPKEMDSHMIQVVGPPKSYYPDWKKSLRQSFGDPFERVKWRSKQNLDQIYLMMYAYYLQPKFYLMLEDDVIASKDYLTYIYEDTEARNDTSYVLVSYCQLGAIGKLFRRNLLPSLATFLSLFWSDKPLDWLLLDYIRTRVCNWSESEKECTNNMEKVQIIYKPSLFQHVGKLSSFPGKEQKLRDKAYKP